MSQKKVQFRGDKAVKLENYLFTGELDVEKKLHDEIDIDEKYFVLQIWQYDDFVNYEYADIRKSEIEGNWSQERTIDGFETIEDVEDTLKEVSFK